MGPLLLRVTGGLTGAWSGRPEWRGIGDPPFPVHRKALRVEITMVTELGEPAIILCAMPGGGGTYEGQQRCPSSTAIGCTGAMKGTDTGSRLEPDSMPPHEKEGTGLEVRLPLHKLEA